MREIAREQRSHTKRILVCVSDVRCLITTHTDSQGDSRHSTVHRPQSEHSGCVFWGLRREPRDFRESGTRLTETQRPDLEGRYVMLAETARDASDSESGLVVAD